MADPIFTGNSSKNDLTEAIEDALTKAKTAINSTFVRWRLLTVRGESGGFVGARNLEVEIVAWA